MHRVTALADHPDADWPGVTEAPHRHSGEVRTVAAHKQVQRGDSYLARVERFRGALAVRAF